MCSIPICVVETTTFLHQEQKSHVCEHERLTHLEQKSSVDRNGNACFSSPLPRTLRGFMAKTERIMKTLFPKIHHMMRTTAVLLSSSCAHVPIIFQTILTFSEMSKLHRIFWKNVITFCFSIKSRWIWHISEMSKFYGKIVLNEHKMI